MIKQISFWLLAFMFFSSCTSKPQYSVMVINKTAGDLSIEYKAPLDVRGKIEESTTLAAGDYQRIISTIDLDIEGVTGLSADHSAYVADYVRAINANSQQSKIEWFDAEKIRFEVVDIGQGEFYIEYTDADFE